MSKDSTTRANRNRAIRQEELRSKLAAQGHVQHVIDIADKLSDLTTELSSTDVQRLKAAADIKKGLISKYLPDTKAVEITGEGGDPIDHKYTVEIVSAEDTNT